MNVLYIIDSLGVGGAEKILINSASALPDYVNTIIVYLNKPDTLIEELQGNRVICLEYKGVKDLYTAVCRLRKLINQYRIDIVHAHLYWSTIIARLACPKNVKLLFSVHSVFSKDIFHNSRLLFFIEKITYSKKSIPVFVSQTVKEDYDKHIGLKGCSHVLYNFVEEKFFIKNTRVLPLKERSLLKVVSVGNLKSSKNYQYLIKVFKEFDKYPISLDIYGEGAYRANLNEMLIDNQIGNIHLKGTNSDIDDLLQNYDLFIMPSKNEGFCIAVAEAMAIGLPCLLSDIQTFKEVSDNNALFFDLDDVKSLLFYLENIDQFRYQLFKNAEQARIRAQEFRIKRYTENLLEIYNSVIPTLDNKCQEPVLV